MKSSLTEALALAGGLLTGLTFTQPASAQKYGGILKTWDFDSPASMSILEESTVAAECSDDGCQTPAIRDRERLGVSGGRCYIRGAVCTSAGEIAPHGAGPKEQPPRKLSGKRTAGGRALWKAAAGAKLRRSPKE